MNSSRGQAEQIMPFSRRTFIHRGSLATIALAASSSLSAGTTLAGDSLELASIRRFVAEYAGQVTVQSDSPKDLTLVCEIADLGKFSEAMASLVPADSPAKANGNTLCFEQNGRQVRIENLWKP